MWKRSQHIPVGFGHAAFIFFECEIGSHINLLYDLTIDDDGRVRMGVDAEGETIRGAGKGFEQDILVYETVAGGQVKHVPRVVAEVKFGGVSTHDAIVYNEKARRIRTVYPYVRYGLLLGGFKTIPGRVLRLGQGFDFIFTMAFPFVAGELDSARALFAEEVASSREVSQIAFGKERVCCVRRRMSVSRACPCTTGSAFTGGRVGLLRCCGHD